MSVFTTKFWGDPLILLLRHLPCPSPGPIGCFQLFEQQFEKKKNEIQPLNSNEHHSSGDGGHNWNLNSGCE